MGTYSPRKRGRTSTLQAGPGAPGPLGSSGQPWLPDAEPRRLPFPHRAPSLLPGILAATRSGLTPARDDELTDCEVHRYYNTSPLALQWRTRDH